MAKKKTSKKQDGFSFNDLPIVKVKNDKDTVKHSADQYFKNRDKVALALFQCLLEGDSAAFMEILDSYLRVNRKRVSEKEDIARSTIQQAFSKNSNPTLKTIAKIVRGTISDQSLIEKSFRR